MRKRSQAIIAAMLALGMAVGMCGCEGQLPTPKATTRQDAPNLSAKQEQKVRTRILKTLDQCNQNRDTDTLPTILEGPELDIRTSELNVAKATGNLDRKTTIPTHLAQAVISTDAGWPRSVFSITSTTKACWLPTGCRWCRRRASSLQSGKRTSCGRRAAERG